MLDPVALGDVAVEVPGGPVGPVGSIADLALHDPFGRLGGGP